MFICDPDLLWSLRDKLAIKAHGDGRLRVKLAMSILCNPRVKELLALPTPERGLRNAHFNPLTRTATVEYDAGVLDPLAIDELFSTSCYERFCALVGELTTACGMRTAS
jgi:hypothetical protein